MKILAFAASNSRKSINRTLLDHAIGRFKSEVDDRAEFEVLDLNDFEMPIYSVDREQESGIPAEARTFFEKIGSADAIMISFAEHNGSVTAAWKNIFDWMSRIDMKLWQNKPMVILAASPGGRGGAGVLQSQIASAPFFAGDIRASHGVGSWYDTFDAETGRLTRAEDIQKLGDALATLALEPA